MSREYAAILRALLKMTCSRCVASRSELRVRVGVLHSPRASLGGTHLQRATIDDIACPSPGHGSEFDYVTDNGRMALARG